MFTNPSSERPPIVEQLRAESRGLPLKPAKRKSRSERLRPSREDAHRLFTIEKGNRWMELARREPEAKTLFGELWHQGELCMMFADTNVGKSVLAVQLGESIARGQSIAPFACQAPPARVLYIDFELSKTQFGLRYSKGCEDHLFSDNFFRAQYNFMPEPPPNVDENELLIAGIEYKVRLSKATVLIIDNITCLRGGTENSAVALALMKSLKALKTDHDLSILVLAHTPKRRNATQPLSADDLHGSKLLINFADSAFAIGKSTANADLCYLKQIKQRNTRQRYGEDNVCLCRMQKRGAFLHFAFEGHSAERLHLLTRTAATRQEFTNKIAALSADGFSQREISGQLGIPLTTVNRLIRCADVERCADMRMCECADEEGLEAAPMTNDVMTNAQKECADMRMCECADEEGLEAAPMTNDVMTNAQKECADMRMCECADEEGLEAAPMTNDVMTNAQKECADMRMCECADEEGLEAAPMTNDVMTNAQKEYADMRMPECADNVEAKVSPTGGDLEGAPETKSLRKTQIYEEFTRAKPMTNDQPTNDQKSREGFSELKIPFEPQISENHVPTKQAMTNDLRTTSAIDTLLTPELLAYILQKKTPENPIRGKGNNDFSQLNTLTNTDVNDGDT